MDNNFKDIRIMDNFYQTSMFFPMPLTLIGTLAEDGKTTSYGAYSLVFPYYIAGKDYYAMVLECRNSSNTCKGLLRHGKCTINFMPYSKKNFAEHVQMGFPGDTPEEKAKALKLFTPIDSLTSEENKDVACPKILKEAIQVLECTWVKDLDGASDDKVQEEYEGPYHNFNGITSKYGAHFILKIDNILMKNKYYDTIINGVSSSGFPNIPVDYGYRDSKNFWYTKFKKPIFTPIPKEKGVGIDTVKYAAERIDPDVKFTDEACQMLVKVPRVFLNMVLKDAYSGQKIIMLR